MYTVVVGWLERKLGSLGTKSHCTRTAPKPPATQLEPSAPSAQGDSEASTTDPDPAPATWNDPKGFRNPDPGLWIWWISDLIGRDIHIMDLLTLWRVVPWQAWLGWCQGQSFDGKAAFDCWQERQQS